MRGSAKFSLYNKYFFRNIIIIIYIILKTMLHKRYDTGGPVKIFINENNNIYISPTLDVHRLCVYI